jgi:hypothetical protein
MLIDDLGIIKHLTTVIPSTGDGLGMVKVGMEAVSNWLRFARR